MQRLNKNIIYVVTFITHITMPYIPLQKFMKELLKTQSNSETKSEIIFIDGLAKTLIEKLGDLFDTNIDLYLKDSHVMSVNVETQLTELSNSEITRLLIVYDSEKKGSKQLTLTKITEYKNDKPNRDDISNEGRIISKLEKKKMIEIKRDPLSEDYPEIIQLSDQGKQYVEALFLSYDELVKIYNRSRNVKIKSFMLQYLELSEKLRDKI